MKYLIIVAILMMTPMMAPTASAQGTVPRYARFETAFTLANQSGNPFDPAENKVDAVVQGPSGSWTIPAFWDGDRWKIRFAPTQVGDYNVSILRSDRPIPAQWLGSTMFTCTDSKDPGYVRRDPKNVQGFQFDNGSRYYPFGLNEAWANGDDGTNYVKTFESMHANGANWARIWMNHWDAKNLEWAVPTKDSPKIGELSLSVARKWDKMMDAAEHNGVYVQMCLQHHGQYTTKVDPNWNDNPFNVKNGGFLTNPEDFFTDATARKLTKAKYRYIVARWGYSPNIAAFELFNEVANIREAESKFDTVIAWHKEMAAYIRALDVNHHLVTTSYSDPGTPLSAIGMDYNQIHAYVPDIISFFASLDITGIKDPFYVGEWGPTGGVRAVGLHDGLWSSVMAPTAGAGMYWFWDGVERTGWPEYKSVSGYLSAFGVADLRGTKKVYGGSESQSHADLVFAFPGNYGPTTSTSVDAGPDGSVTGIAGISSYIHGTGHREMLTKPIDIHLDAAAPTQFKVRIARVAKGGAHPQLSLDGAVLTEKDYPATERDTRIGESLTVDVPVGKHTVSVFNTGADWYSIENITVTDYAPVFGVIARGNGKAVAFWAYNRNRSNTDPVDGSVIVPWGRRGGKHKVRLWDTWTGQELPAVDGVSKNGMLSIPLQGVKRDIAGVVR